MITILMLIVGIALLTILAIGALVCTIGGGIALGLFLCGGDVILLIFLLYRLFKRRK